MDVGIERVINSLKGVASILATMSEVPAGNIIWSECSHEMLYDRLAGCIRQLEDIACIKETEDED